MEAETDAYLHHHEYCCHSNAGGSCHGDGKLPVQHRMFMHGSSATAKPAQGLKVSQVALGAAGSSLLQAGAGTEDAEVMKVGCHPVAAPAPVGIGLKVQKLLFLFEVLTPTWRHRHPQLVPG